MIKTINSTYLTNYRDFVCEDADAPNLPHDCCDGSTAIATDTGKEYVFHKIENEWREEARPIPGYIWLGEWTSLTAIKTPAYGSLAAVKDENGRRLYWFNGIKWKELKEENK